VENKVISLPPDHNITTWVEWMGLRYVHIIDCLVTAIQRYTISLAMGFVPVSVIDSALIFCKNGGISHNKNTIYSILPVPRMKCDNATNSLVESVSIS